MVTMLTRNVFMVRLLVCIIGAALTTACTQFGPKIIEASRTDYNIAMSQTDGEQVLLNLVRLRYGDAPYFLEATALNTQFSVAPSAQISSSLDFDGGNTYGLQGRFAYEEKPTVTYSPLRGEDFVRRVLARVSLDTVLLLDASGWSTERVLRLCVEKLNGLDNASRASGPTPRSAPQVSRFGEAVRLMSQFEQRGDLSMRRQKSGDSERFVAVFSSDAVNTPDYQRLSDLLNLDPTLREYELTFNQIADNAKTINFQTRSFSGVMYFLSQSVEVPAEDVDAGKVTITTDGAGNVFDWSTVTGGLMQVKSSSRPPADASVAVKYRQRWFFIQDSDIDSKASFALLGQLFALQSKGTATGAPILTIPIGG